MRGMLVVVGALCLASGCTQKRVALTQAEATPSYRPSTDEVAELKSVLRDTTLYFQFDDAGLSQANQRKLQRLADALRSYPWATVRIAGHCDDRGTEEYNLALGQRRADSARSYLLALGVDPRAVETVSFGHELPAADGWDEDSYALNRRDEVELVPDLLLGMR